MNLRHKSTPAISLVIFACLALVTAFGVSSAVNQTAEAQNGICDRSLPARAAILAELNLTDCADVTDAHLSAIDHLSVISGNGLMAGDLDGLTGVEELTLRGWGYFPTPNGIFAQLTSLKSLVILDFTVTGVLAADFDSLENLAQFEELVLYGPRISSIETDSFAGLNNLKWLWIYAHALTTIESGIFNGLGNLQWLLFYGNAVNTVAPGAFDGVGEGVNDGMRGDSEFGVLYLRLNALETLGADTFTGLAGLERLALHSDALSTIEVGAFNGLDSLYLLYLSAGALSNLPTGTFSPLDELEILRLNKGGKEILETEAPGELTSIVTLDLWDQSVTTLKRTYFDTLGHLQRLFVDHNTKVERVESRAFDDLTQLKRLTISDNKIRSLPDRIFEPLTELEHLDLSNNLITTLPDSFIASPPCSLHTLNIGGNRFRSVPAAEIDGINYNILSTLPQPNRNGCGPDEGINHIHLDDIPMTQDDLDLIEPYRVVETLSLANTGITATQAINVRRGTDLVTIKRLDLSYNDLSGLNDHHQRAALPTIVGRLNVLEELLLAGTKIDGETAMIIAQNLPPSVKRFSLADNDLTDWNNPDLAPALKAAFSAVNKHWELMDLSNTGLDSTAAASIVPSISRQEAGRPVGLYEVDEKAPEVTLDLSNNLLTRFEPSWIRGWEQAITIDLSCNDISSLKPEWFTRLATHLNRLYLNGNSLPRQDIDDWDDVLPNLTSIDNGRACHRSDYTIPKSTSRILSIEPSIDRLAINPGSIVRLEIDFYGRQKVLDNDLAEQALILWSDGRAGGNFSGTGRQIHYTAPEAPGKYTILARVPSSQCYGDFDQCGAEFQVAVIRRSSIDTTAVEPVNPQGEIPNVLTDNEGTAYEVLTPVDGGQYIGDGFTLAAPTGAIQNGEFIGISIEKGEAASNIGQTHLSYTLAGHWYRISTIDADRQPISNYQLNAPAQACIPLPDEFRSNIDDLAIMAVDSESFAILSSRVYIKADGSVRLCGNISALPAEVAAAKRGAPSAPTTPVPPEQSEEIKAPDTGGREVPSGFMIIALLLGIGIAYAGVRHLNRNTHLLLSHGGRGTE